MEFQLDQPVATTERRQITYTVECLFAVPPEAVWEKLTDKAALLEWDSNLMELNGDIGPGGRIKLRSKMSPKQTFRLKVSEYQPYEKMVWSSSMGPLFKGVRTFELRSHHTGTHFRMYEVFSGWLLPLMRNQLPDCEILFGTYIKDLRQALHSS